MGGEVIMKFWENRFVVFGEFFRKVFFRDKGVYFGVVSVFFVFICCVNFEFGFYL